MQSSHTMEKKPLDTLYKLIYFVKVIKEHTCNNMIRLFTDSNLY